MTWLPNAHVVDLTGRSNGAGNGPFGGSNAGQFLGIALHCNGGVGVDTPDQFFIDGGGPDSVCPNFQVHADGTIAQYLPMEWSPWCQRNGNANYAAIETAGGPDPLNAAQLASVARIVRAYHDVMGMSLQLAEAPGQRGLGYHAMGGTDWGGHPCPLPARIAQRAQILQLASGGDSTLSNGATPIGDEDMPLTQTDLDKIVAALRPSIVNASVAAQNKTQATATALGDQINAVAKNTVAAVHTDNVTVLKPTIDRVSHMYPQVETTAQTITALHAAGGDPDLTQLITAIDALPEKFRLELAKHLGA